MVRIVFKQRGALPVMISDSVVGGGRQGLLAETNCSAYALPVPTIPTLAIVKFAQINKFGCFYISKKQIELA